MRVVVVGAALLLLAILTPTGAARPAELDFFGDNPCFGAKGVYEAAPVLVDALSSPGCTLVFTGMADGTTSPEGLPLFLGDWTAL